MDKESRHRSHDSRTSNSNLITSPGSRESMHSPMVSEIQEPKIGRPRKQENAYIHGKHEASTRGSHTWWTKEADTVAMVSRIQEPKSDDQGSRRTHTSMVSRLQAEEPTPDGQGSRESIHSHGKLNSGTHNRTSKEARERIHPW